VRDGQPSARGAYVWVQYRAALKRYRCPGSSWYHSWDSSGQLARQIRPAVSVWDVEEQQPGRGVRFHGESTRSQKALGLLLTLVAVAVGLSIPHSLGNISRCIQKQ